MRARDIVASRANSRLKQLRAAVAGNLRLSGGLVAIEGEHLIAEAVRSGVRLRTVFLAGESEHPDGLDRETEVVRVTEEAFRSAVETRTPRGLAALLEPRLWTTDAVLGDARRPALVLVLAELQDPGNVGTLLRSAEAFGATGAVLSAGSASVWSGKAMRASAGSVFRLPTLRVNGPAEVRAALGPARLLAAVGSSMRGRTVGNAAVEDLTGPTAFLLGNEGSGLAPDWLSSADGQITIPCTGPVESLNAAVAGAVLLYEAQQQRTALDGARSARSQGRGPELVRRSGQEREGGRR